MKRGFLISLFTLILGCFFISGIGSTEERVFPFPSYGSGSIEVRLYTDYFCSPCRYIEPEVEPILKRLINNNEIRLTFVDVPFNQNTPLYARYFLYALRAKNDLEHAIGVRNILMETSTKKDVTSQARIEGVFKEKGIPFSVFDTKPVFDLYNELIKEDKTDGTPTCVIIKNGKKSVFEGGPDIVNALKSLP